MKKLLTIVSLLLCISCNEKGQISHSPEDFIIIHNKTYKLMNVIPCDDCDGIWIMYPKDSTDNIPQIVNFTTSSGKVSSNQTVIKID